VSRTIAAQRIRRLFDLARAAARAGETARARTYVRRARRIAERQRLSLPREFERFTCGGCDGVLLPGRNARVRTRSGHVVVTCSCGHQSRYPYD
jgi:ribonuclease P protein subunit RPR2